MYNFKKLKTEEEKKQYKKQYYKIFKNYDIIKRNMRTLKNKYNINGEEELRKKLSDLKQDRNLLYSSLNSTFKELEQLKDTRNTER